MHEKAGVINDGGCLFLSAGIEPFAGNVSLFNALL